MEAAENGIRDAPDEETVARVKGLLDEVKSARGERKAEAETELRAMGSEAALVIVKLLEPRTEKSRKGIRLFRRLQCWTFAYILLLCVIWIVARSARQWPSVLYLCLLPALLYFVALITFAAGSMNSPPARWIELLAELSDKRMLPALLDVYGHLPAMEGKKLLPASTRLLPTLQSEDRLRFSSDQRSRLHRFLRHYLEHTTPYPTELIIAVLKGLGAVGDASSLPLVRRASKMRRNALVSEAASECLKTLETQARADEHSLLRAASTGRVREEQLLRAAEAGQDTNVTELLRGTGENNGSPMAGSKGATVMSPELACPVPVKRQLEGFCAGLEDALAANLAGIYLHGSLAFGFFNPSRSDIDLLAVTEGPMETREKRKAAELLLHFSNRPRPVEITLVTRQALDSNVYPMPFELHYGEDWRQPVQEQLAKGEWERWNDVRQFDPDLAGQIAVTRKRGICLRGFPIAKIIPVVPKDAVQECFFSECEWALERIAANPVYGILNPCRVWAYFSEGCLLSKEEGGEWALERVPEPHRAVIIQALAAYRDVEASDTFDRTDLHHFADYILDSVRVASQAP